jgi:hypothetical protein
MALPFADASFDVVVCQFGVMFLPGYHDTAIIGRDLLDGGFAGRATFDVLEARSRAPSCRVPAIGYCEGTPLRMEIEARRPGGVAEATEVAAAAIGERFGRVDVDGKIRGLVVTVENS